MHKHSIYFNEFDRYATAWLKELVDYPAFNTNDSYVVVDDRSVVDVVEEYSSYVGGFDECHFFAGIGGWRRAFDLAGVDVPGLCRNIGGAVWTASLPCQPFSIAGHREGTNDERHLFPVFRRLVEEHKPAIIFGEQVASRDGKEWLAGVRTDLEALGYAVGAADLCAAGVGAPHLRQRLYWVAISECNAGESRRTSKRPGSRISSATERESIEFGRSGDACGVADSDSSRHERFGRSEFAGKWAFGENDLGVTGEAGFWKEYTISPCRDPKREVVFRRIPRLESGIFPLVDGLPRGMGRLRNKSAEIGPAEVNATAEARRMRLKGYGNAIVPQLAALFIQAVLQTL